MTSSGSGSTSRADYSPCPKCKVKHRPGQRCPKREDAAKTLPVIYSHLTLSKITNKEELKEYILAAKKTAGNCPACSKPYTFERKFPFGKFTVPSHRFGSCPTFQAMTPKLRGELIEKKACWSCLDWLHTGSDCPHKERKKCTVQIGSGTCDGVHEKLLHGSGVAYCHLTKPTLGMHTLFSRFSI